MNIKHNPPTAILYKNALSDKSKNYNVSNTGALLSTSGKYTGRKPDWKHIVYEKKTKNIWWGDVNHKIDKKSFYQASDIAKKHIFAINKDIYCMDSTINWNSKYSFKIRLYTNNPYHALFFKNMTIPSDNKFISDDIDLTIYNAGNTQ